MNIGGFYQYIEQALASGLKAQIYKPGGKNFVVSVNVPNQKVMLAPLFEATKNFLSVDEIKGMTDSANWSPVATMGDLPSLSLSKVLLCDQASTEVQCLLFEDEAINAEQFYKQEQEKVEPMMVIQILEQFGDVDYTKLNKKVLHKAATAINEAMKMMPYTTDLLPNGDARAEALRTYEAKQIMEPVLRNNGLILSNLQIGSRMAKLNVSESENSDFMPPIEYLADALTKSYGDDSIAALLEHCFDINDEDYFSSYIPEANQLLEELGINEHVDSVDQFLGAFSSIFGDGIDISDSITTEHGMFVVDAVAKIFDEGSINALANDVYDVSKDDEESDISEVGGNIPVDAPAVPEPKQQNQGQRHAVSVTDEQLKSVIYNLLDEASILLLYDIIQGKFTGYDYDDEMRFKVYNHIKNHKDNTLAGKFIYSSYFKAPEQMTKMEMLESFGLNKTTTALASYEQPFGLFKKGDNYYKVRATKNKDVFEKQELDFDGGQVATTVDVNYKPTSKNSENMEKIAMLTRTNVDTNEEGFSSIIFTADNQDMEVFQSGENEFVIQAIDLTQDNFGREQAVIVKDGDKVGRSLENVVRFINTKANAIHESEDTSEASAEYLQSVDNFLQKTWQEDDEIEFVSLINEYRNMFAEASDSKVKSYLKRMYDTNFSKMKVSERFTEELLSLFENNDVSEFSRPRKATSKDIADMERIASLTNTEVMFDKDGGPYIAFKSGSDDMLLAIESANINGKIGRIFNIIASVGGRGKGMKTVSVDEVVKYINLNADSVYETIQEKMVSDHKEFMEFFTNSFNGDDRLEYTIHEFGFNSPAVKQEIEMMIGDWILKFCQGNTPQGMKMQDFVSNVQNSIEYDDIENFLAGFYQQEIQPKEVKTMNEVKLGDKIGHVDSRMFQGIIDGIVLAHEWKSTEHPHLKFEVGDFKDNSITVFYDHDGTSNSFTILKTESYKKLMRDLYDAMDEILNTL